jgi:hypothetical protein
MRLKKRTDSTFPNEKTYARFGSKAQLLARLGEFAARESGQFGAILAWLPAPLDVVETDDAAEPASVLEIGTVYLLRFGKFYKIGRSNSAGRRERESALQLPEKVRMVHVIRTDDPPGIEAYWHRRFADRRKNGEWFELVPSDVAAFRRRKFM